MSPDQPIHVLLVEDNETDIQIMLGAFDKSKIALSVNSVCDGEDALKYLQHEFPYKDKNTYLDPDIILLDVDTPRMDGHAFVQKVRSLKNAQDIPIIIVTNKEDYQFRLEGVNDYVTKSLDGMNVLKKIEEIMSFKKEFFTNNEADS